MHGDAQVQVLELPVKQNNLKGVVRSADGGDIPCRDASHFDDVICSRFCAMRHCSQDVASYRKWTSRENLVRGQGPAIATRPHTGCEASLYTFP